MFHSHAKKQKWNWSSCGWVFLFCLVVVVGEGDVCLIRPNSFYVNIIIQNLYLILNYYVKKYIKIRLTNLFI